MRPLDWLLLLVGAAIFASLCVLLHRLAPADYLW
jgi:hypothetical protein